MYFSKNSKVILICIWGGRGRGGLQRSADAMAAADAGDGGGSGDVGAAGAAGAVVE